MLRRNELENWVKEYLLYRFDPINKNRPPISHMAKEIVAQVLKYTNKEIKDES